jgi:adenylosuccinate lyase
MKIKETIMMVDQSRYVDNVRSLIKDLDQAATKLTEISAKQKISNQEIKDLMSTLKNVNVNLDPSFWEDKKLAPEEMKVTIEKALNASALFQKVAQKNVEQAIASLFASLTSTLNDFDKNLRNLKELKIGQKVEKSGESKRA